METKVNLQRFEGVQTDIELEKYVGRSLPMDVQARFHTLDGSCVAAYLSMIGYEVVKNEDTGRNGLAVTKEGYRVSTNGYVSKDLSIEKQFQGKE